MKVDTDDLVAAVDVAELMGVRQSAVSNWGRRDTGFPTPVATVANGRTHLWRRQDILKWMADRERARSGDPRAAAAMPRRRAAALERLADEVESPDGQVR